MGRTASTKFTALFIKNLKPRETQYALREGRGFGVRVLPSGLIMWYYTYTASAGNRRAEAGPRSPQRNIHLGNYPEVSLAEARLKYQELYAANQRGEHIGKYPEPAHNPTLFCKLAEAAMLELSVTQEWSKTLQYALDKDVLPVWGRKDIKDITRSDARAMLQTVEQRSYGATGNVKKAAQVVMEYAIDHEYIDNNPLLNLTRSVPSLKARNRTRFLTEDEIRVFWNAQPDTAVGRALRLILLTAQRPGEAAGLHRMEIQADVWTIPFERARKGRGAHVVPLTSTALELIGDSAGFCFADERSPDKHAVNRSSLSLSISSVGYYGLQRFTPHDLRRTARTYMAKIGIPEHIAEAILNHAKPGMQRIYNQWEYQEEKKAALIQWEQELLRILHIK